MLTSEILSKLAMVRSKPTYNGSPETEKKRFQTCKTPPFSFIFARKETFCYFLWHCSPCSLVTSDVSCIIATPEKRAMTKSRTKQVWLGNQGYFWFAENWTLANLHSMVNIRHRWPTDHPETIEFPQSNTLFIFVLIFWPDSLCSSYFQLQN